MKPLRSAILVLAILTSALPTWGQSLSVIINHSPATIQITSKAIDSVVSFNLREDLKIRLTVEKDEWYILTSSHLGDDPIVKDSIYATAGQILTFDIKLTGKCLYDLPPGAVPTCPKGHSDQIIPIEYGLIGFTGNASALIDSTFHLGGCVVTGCDPQNFCKIHKIEF